MAKSEQTRQMLYQTALKLFASDGFEATTMRQIAKKAGVAPGAIYYYFESKESLVQHYYEQLHIEHEKSLVDFFEKEKKLSERLHRVVTAKIEMALPHKDMALALYRVAANPQSSLSPFSAESKLLREKAITIFENLIQGCDQDFHKELKPLLPKYLWFYLMGVILFWIYDKSKKSQRTFEFIDKTVPLIVWLIDSFQSAWAAPFRKKVLQTLKEFEPNFDETVSEVI